MEKELYKDLSTAVDKSQVECLNAADKQSIQYMVCTPNNKQKVVSDSDEQLLVKIGFMAPVKIHHIVMHSQDSATQPKSIKLFVNRPAMDFSQAENESADQILEMEQGQDHLELKYVKFQKVLHLSILVENNHGAEQTVLDTLSLYGLSSDATNMNELKKVEHE